MGECLLPVITGGTSGANLLADVKWKDGTWQADMRYYPDTSKDWLCTDGYITLKAGHTYSIGNIYFSPSDMTLYTLGFSALLATTGGAYLDWIIIENGQATNSYVFRRCTPTVDVRLYMNVWAIKRDFYPIVIEIDPAGNGVPAVDFDAHVVHGNAY